MGTLHRNPNKKDRTGRSFLFGRDKQFLLELHKFLIDNPGMEFSHRSFDLSTMAFDDKYEAVIY